MRKSIAILMSCLLLACSAFGATNLRVSKNGHYIETTGGTPFLYLGDTEWLLNKHSDAQITTLLDDRASKGFTVIQVFSTRNWPAPPDSSKTDFKGHYPFINNDVNQLDTAYWNRWSWIADQCARRNLVLALHIGEAGRKDAPWLCSDKNQCYEYGRKIGETFKDKTNIIFNIGQDMHGTKGVGEDGWRAIAKGVADGVNGVNDYNGSTDYNTTFLSFHPGGESPYTSSTRFHPDSWLDANGAEVWHKTGTVYSLVNADNNKNNPVKPILMVEGWYEEEKNCTSKMVRNEAWHTFFAGGFYGYGHNDNWAQPDGIDYINSPGAQQISVLARFLNARKWWNFIPDQEMIASGLGNDTTLKAAVKSSRGDECYIYYPTNSSAQIVLNRITTAPNTNAKWFDPRNGQIKSAGAYKTSQTLSFTPPTGWDDAVLCLNSAIEDRRQPITAAKINGVLRINPANRRYFTNNNGKAVYLTGSHTWATLQDGLITNGDNIDPAPAFNYNGYLDFLQQYNHNFIRLWVTDLPKTDYSQESYGKAVYYPAPLPWKRSGAKMAADGKPKFNLKQFNRGFFDRLRERVIAARDRGIYVSVMLFDGWNIYWHPGNKGWNYAPFNVKNNVNGINGDTNGDGQGFEAHSLQNQELVSLQEAYIRKVIDTVNDLDNVLYEISNEESNMLSKDWSYHLINFIKKYESGKAKQHPVGMTAISEAYKPHNEWLTDGPADWISPYCLNGGTPEAWDLPVADGKKVVLLDTDHIWGIGGNDVWVWKAFMRGHNPLYMDPYGSAGFVAADETARRAMGQTLNYASLINLGAMLPRTDISSTKYALVNQGKEYLVYQPVAGASFTINLNSGSYTCEWLNVGTSDVVTAGIVTATGTNQNFTPPFNGQAVLYLRKNDIKS